jgi:eukaryotic-like serine/threonine-protein kinase
LTIKIGDTIGDYKVVDLAGSGGMGAVYRIEHLITKRVEAMKVLPTSLGSTVEDIRRFEREIEVQARLHHPNIVALYNAIRDDQSIALIMEYIEGESLYRILQSGKLPLRTAVDYASQVLKALAYAHARGVIHRDVTPSNIIITPEGAAKLTDFGIALAADDIRLTTPGVAMGSAWYMSPEQVRAAALLDNRTDLYAVGAVFHEMLTGGKLFDADGSFAVMRAQLEMVPRPPSMLNPQVPGAFDEIVARSLAKDPAQRYQTAEEFHKALEAAAAGLTRTTGVKEITGWKAMRRSRRTMVPALAPVALVAVIGLAIWPHAKQLVGGGSLKPDSVPGPALTTISPPPTQSAPAMSAKAATGTSELSPTHANKPTSPARATKATPQLQQHDSLPEQSSEEATQPKTGNRFIRVLGKLNPFHRGAKNVSDEP